MNIMETPLFGEECFRTWKSSSFKLRKGGGCCQHNHRRSLLDVSTFKQLNMPFTLPETHGFRGKLIPFTGKLLLAHFPLNDIFELIRGCKLHGFSFVIAITVIQND